MNWFPHICVKQNLYNWSQGEGVPGAAPSNALQVGWGAAQISPVLRGAPENGSGSPQEANGTLLAQVCMPCIRRALGWAVPEPGALLRSHRKEPWRLLVSGRY